MRPAETFVQYPVRSLQTMLRILAEDDENLPSLVPDGIYSSQTRQAVTAFQRKFALPATGVVDQPTWDRIVAEHASARVRLGPAEPLQLILNPNQVIRRGESHPYLFLVQSMLSVISDIYASIPEPGISGIMDEATIQSIASFQNLNELPATGELDKITWKHLALQYPLAVNIQNTQNRRHR